MKISDKALEQIVLDVMGGMEALTTGKGPENPPHQTETDPWESEPEAQPKAVVLPFPGNRKSR